jgi:hypothetical protein
MAHTSTPVAVGVHSIGTCCIRPSDAGQVGSGQVGSGQVGAVHIGAEHVGSDQVGALQIGAVPVGADEVTSRKVNPGVRGDRTVVGDTVGAFSPFSPFKPYVPAGPCGPTEFHEMTVAPVLQLGVVTPTSVSFPDLRHAK